MALNLEFKLGPDSKSPTLRCNLSRLVLLDVELCSMLRGSLDGRGVWGRMDTRICVAKSLRGSPETITTLLISYTPIENKKLR